MDKMHSTDFLVAKNSFLSGMGRALDIGSTRKKFSYNESESTDKADRRALINDWSMVGQDLRGATYAIKSKEKANS